MLKEIVQTVAEVKNDPDSFEQHFSKRALSPHQLEGRLHRLGINLTRAEFEVFAVLNTPPKVQRFLNEYVSYNRLYLDSNGDSAYSPRQVLKNRQAHCFEGAMFAYAVNFIHGWDPKIVLLEAVNDYDHNLCLYQDPETGLYGANSKSGFKCGTPPEHASPHEVVRCYEYAYSDPKNSIKLYNRDMGIQSVMQFPASDLAGFSEGIDIASRYGTDWITSPTDIWHIYHTYINRDVKFYSLNNPSGETHLHPFVKAVAEGWFTMGGNKLRGKVDVKKLPLTAQLFWKIYWQEERALHMHDYEVYFWFIQTVGMPPSHLRDMARYDYPEYLKSGFSL